MLPVRKAAATGNPLQSWYQDRTKPKTADLPHPPEDHCQQRQQLLLHGDDLLFQNHLNFQSQTLHQESCRPRVEASLSPVTNVANSQIEMQVLWLVRCRGACTSALFAMKVANGEEVVALCAPNFIHYSVEIPRNLRATFASTYHRFALFHPPKAG